MAPITDALQRVAHILRIHSVNATSTCKSGHPTTCSSIAEIMSVLFFYTMKLNINNPRDPCSDRLVLSKGHAAPILYAAWAEAGLFPTSELLNLRKITSDLEGHPTPRLNFVDVGTGSLGQGLSIACGMAYVGKYYDKGTYRVYCIIGDGESYEGQIWEAVNFAHFKKLDNLCIILDVNKLSQTGETPLGHNVEEYQNRFEAFGLNTLIVDGHSVRDLMNAFDCAANTPDAPTVLICKTIKGKNFPNIEGQNGWHGKALGDKTCEVLQYLKSLIRTEGCNEKLELHPPCKGSALLPALITNLRLSSAPNYKIGDGVATRTAYGTALAKLAELYDRVIALDGDMSNSTFSEKVLKKVPDQFIECQICEQNMISVAMGCACRDRTVCFASTFGSFLPRAFDQIRMGAISQTNINICGSHAGISIGEDGPSQMALEDIAMFRTVPECTIFYPSDAVSTERAVELAANTKGMCYIRTSRPDFPVIYDNSEVFEVGKAKIIKHTNKDRLLIIAAGVTMREAIKAYEILKKNCRYVRILDPFTIKPLDKCAIVHNAKECGSKILTVEDHYAEGGLGEAVLEVVGEELIKVKKLAVHGVPRSGPSLELLDMFEISAKSIVKAADQIITSC